MIKIPSDFISSITDSVPKSAWHCENLVGTTCYTLRNKTYAKNFWMAYWYKILQPMFKNQEIATVFESIDLTVPVIITKNMFLVKPPPVYSYLVNIAESSPDVPPRFIISLSGFDVIVIYFIGIIIICILTFIGYKFKPEYINPMIV
jgi:hypothetical protein